MSAGWCVVGGCVCVCVFVCIVIYLKYFIHRYTNDEANYHQRRKYTQIYVHGDAHTHTDKMEYAFSGTLLHIIIYIHIQIDCSALGQVFHLASPLSSHRI